MTANPLQECEHLNPKSNRRRRGSHRFLPSALPLTTKLCYACGHMLNDLCAAIWFTYLLIFLQYIVKMSSTKAGIIMMVGQVADAFCTPLIGIQSDRRRMLCIKNAKRKSWHLLGTICIIISFPLLFTECRSCDETSIGVYLGLILLVIIFQFGWAATQVSHLSLIPEITSYSRERDLLNNLRYSVEEFAELFVFFVALVIFNVDDDSSKETQTIGEEDAPKFRNLVYTITGVGFVFAVVFQLGVHENTKSESDNLNCDQENLIVESNGFVTRKTKELANVEDNAVCERVHSPQPVVQEFQSWRKWLRDPRFYQVCAIYLFSRMFSNLSSVYFPLYLEESLGAPQNMIIYIPIVLNLSGLATCLVLNPINDVIGKKITFALFCCISLCGCLVIFLDGSPNFAGRGEYVIAVLIGSGSAAMMAIALSFVPDLLATDVQNGAFMYGLFSFVEKLVNGIAVLITQYLHDLVCEDFEECVWYYRNFMLFVLGAIVLAAFVCIATLFPVRFTLYERKTMDINWPIEPVDEPKLIDAADDKSACDSRIKSTQYGSM